MAERRGENEGVDTDWLFSVRPEEKEKSGWLGDLIQRFRLRLNKNYLKRQGNSEVRTNQDILQFELDDTAEYPVVAKLDCESFLTKYNSISCELREKLFDELHQSRVDSVARESEVMIIADLHGYFQAYVGNLLAAGLVDEELNWIAGDAKVVFLGDTIADRHLDGFKILNHKRKLKDQAKAVGGSVESVFGNHENYALEVLTTGRDLSSPERRGLQEFEVFGFYPDMRPKDAEAALNFMREDERGRMCLEELCEMKLVWQIDDVLCTHTPLTMRMLAIIMVIGVDNLNYMFQEDLRRTLLEGKDSFFDCGLRTHLALEDDLLRQLGIKDIFSDCYDNYSDWHKLRYVFLHTNNSVLESRHKNNCFHYPIFYPNRFLNSSSLQNEISFEERSDLERIMKNAACFLNSLGINRLVNGHDGEAEVIQGLGVVRYCVDTLYRQSWDGYDMKEIPAVLGVAKNGQLLGLQKLCARCKS